MKFCCFVAFCGFNFSFASRNLLTCCLSPIMKRPAGKVSPAGSITKKRPAGPVPVRKTGGKKKDAKPVKPNGNGGKKKDAKPVKPNGAKKKDAKPVKPTANTNSKPVKPKGKPAAAVTPELTGGHPVVTTALPEDILPLPVEYAEKSELIRFRWFWSSVLAHFGNLSYTCSQQPHESCAGVLHVFFWWFGYDH